MQQYKPKFSNLLFKDTFSNVQRCLRLNDLDEIGDSTHYLVFHMLGFFSFREWTVQQTVNFWLQFMKHINTYPDYVTIHPDKPEWRELYPSDMEVRFDEGCKWSDGSIGGYCTEFYKDDVEIGNIVNTLGTCIDVGFGCERLLSFTHGVITPDKEDILINSIESIIESGIEPGHHGHGYILKKLLTELVFSQGFIEHPFYWKIVDNQLQQFQTYTKMVSRSQHYRQKDNDWWMRSFGIDLNNLDRYEVLKKKHPKR